MNIKINGELVEVLELGMSFSTATIRVSVEFYENNVEKIMKWWKDGSVISANVYRALKYATIIVGKDSVELCTE